MFDNVYHFMLTNYYCIWLKIFVYVVHYKNKRIFLFSLYTFYRLNGFKDNLFTSFHLRHRGWLRRLINNRHLYNNPIYINGTVSRK